MSQKSFPKIVIIIAIIVFAGMIGYFALRGENGLKTGLKTILNPQIVIEPPQDKIDKNKWTTYTSSKHKFSISYPEYFQFIGPEGEISENVTGVFQINEPWEKEYISSWILDIITIRVWIWKNPSDLSLKDFIIKRSWPSPQLENEIKEEIGINGLEGLKITNTNFNGVNIEVLSIKDDKIYSIYGDVQVRDETKEEKLILINQIINSFKFI